MFFSWAGGSSRGPHYRLQMGKLGTYPQKEAQVPGAAKDHIIVGEFMYVPYNHERNEKAHWPKHL